MADDGGGADGADGHAIRCARGRLLSTHNVIILVPFTHGGGTDLLARAYAQILENKYDKTFVVENRPGGGTTIAATATANATPDGRWR